jgi:hypothetical protein
VSNAPVARDARALLAAGATVRIEAMRRGWTPERGALHGLAVAFAEDDGSLVRLFAVTTLALRHPLRCLRHHRAVGDLAPVVRRLRRSDTRHLHAMGGGRAPELAAELARLANLPFSAHAADAGQDADGLRALVEAARAAKR